MGRLRQCFRFNQYCDGCVRETDQLTNVPDPDLPQTTIDLCDDCLESLLQTIEAIHGKEEAEKIKALGEAL